jgi:hypothetical protein
MGSHSKPRQRASVTKVVGLAGMATAAATVAMSVGAGTAQADNTPLKPNTPSTPSTTAGTTLATTTGPLGSLGSLGSLGPIFNPGPFTFGPVTNPPLKAPQTYVGQFLFTPAVPGSRPFPSVQGFQLPFWSVNSSGAPVPFA